MDRCRARHLDVWRSKRRRPINVYASLAFRTELMSAYDVLAPTQGCNRCLYHCVWVRERKRETGRTSPHDVCLQAVNQRVSRVIFLDQTRLFLSILSAKHINLLFWFFFLYPLMFSVSGLLTSCARGKETENLSKSFCLWLDGVVLWRTRGSKKQNLIDLRSFFIFNAALCFVDLHLTFPFSPP